MSGGRIGALGTLVALLALAAAGPLHRLPRESEDYQSLDPYDNYTANEMCFSDNRVFQKGALMPNPGPCEECRCEPPSIVCNMIKCPVNNNGCRTIQRANHCCPDYNCECDYNGQLYNDGERLDLPEEPCQVCYCKGGEVMCTSITCYKRDDCTPIHVPGQCCPKYENCPIRDEATNGEDKDGRTKPSNKTASNSPKREMQPWLLTKSIPQASSLPIPKPADGTTTENGNIVIVSDWLTERKTTTEDAAGQEVSKQETTTLEHTEGPTVVTDFGHSIVAQQQKKDAEHVDGSGIVVKSETITPVDEVIFTRIDMIKESKNEDADSTTSTSSIIVDVEKLQKNREEEQEFISLGKTTDVEFMTTTPVYQKQDDDMSLQMKNVDDSSKKETDTLSTESTSDKTTSSSSSSLADSTGSHNLNEKEDMKSGYVTPIDTTSDTTVNGATPNIVADRNKNTTSNNTASGNDIKIQHTNASRNEYSEEKVNDSNLNGQNDHGTSEQITLENSFGLNTSSADEVHHSSTIEPTVHHDSGKPEKILREQPEDDRNTQNKDDVLTNKPDTTEGYFIENFLEDESKVLLTNYEGEKDSSDVSNGSVLQGQLVDDDNTLTTTEEEIETTTPYFTEDHMSGLNMEADAVLQGFRSVEEEKMFSDVESTTGLEETTVDPVVETETSSERISSGKQEDLLFETENANILMDDSATIDYDGSTESTTTDPISDSDVETELFTADFSEDEPKYDIQEITPLTHGENNTLSPVKAAVSDLEVGSTNVEPRIDAVNVTPSKVGNQSAVQNNTLSVNTVEEQEVTLNVHYEDLSSEVEEGVSNAPPVLELNSHVPFLQLGGHYSSDISSGENDEPNSTALPTEEERNPDATKMERVEIYEEPKISLDASGGAKEKTEPFDIPLTTLPPSGDKINTDVGVNTKKSVESRTETEGFTTVVPTMISLTPGDLRALAEYLIHEKIKPVTKVDSVYSPNQWLTGNLTSEENMASIISAANISIGIMNQTETGLKTTSPETSTRSNDIIQVEKFDKEGIFKGNSIVDLTNKVLNKTGSLHNKDRNIQEVSKSFYKPQSALNDGANIHRELSTESLNEIFPSSTGMNLKLVNEKVTENILLQSSPNSNGTDNLKDLNLKKNDSVESTNKNYKEHTYPFTTIPNSRSPSDKNTPTVGEPNNGNIQNLKRYRIEDKGSEASKSIVTEESSRSTESLTPEVQKPSSPSVNNDLTTPKQVPLKHSVVP